MREGLAVVVETEMRAAYDDLWYVFTRLFQGLATLDFVFDSVLGQLLVFCSLCLGQAF